MGFRTNLTSARPRVKLISPFEPLTAPTLSDPECVAWPSFGGETVNNSAKKQHHEQARKKHRHEQQEHARELANQKRSPVALWFLISGLVLMAVIIAIVLLA